MALHARSVAIAAGAEGQQVESVAQKINERGEVTLDAAIKALAQLVASSEL